MKRKIMLVCKTLPAQYGVVLKNAILTCNPPLLEGRFEQWFGKLDNAQKDAVFKDIIANSKQLGGLFAVIRFALCSLEGKQQLQNMLLEKIPISSYGDVLKEKDKQGNTILHYLAAKNPLVLKSILTSLSNDEARVEAVQKQNKENWNVLHVLARYRPKAFLDILEVLPRAAYAALIKQVDTTGKTFLTNFIKAGDFQALHATWEKLCAVLEPGDLVAVVQKDDLLFALAYHYQRPGALKTLQAILVTPSFPINREKLGGLPAVIRFAFGHLEEKQQLQNMLLEKIPISSYGDVLNEKDEQGNTIWHYLAEKNPLVLKSILTSLSNDEARVEAVQKQNKENWNVLHELARSQPKAFLDILEILPRAAYAALIKQVDTTGKTFLTNFIKAGDFQTLHATWEKLCAGLEPEDLVAVVQTDKLLYVLAHHYWHPGALKALQAILATPSFPEESLLAEIKKKVQYGKTFIHMLAERSFDAFKTTLEKLPVHLRLAALSEKDESGTPVAITAGLPRLAEVLPLVADEKRLQILMLKDGNGATVLHGLAYDPNLLIENLRLLPQEDTNWQTVMDSKDKEGRALIDFFLSQRYPSNIVEEVRALIPLSQRENSTLHELAFLEGEALLKKLESLPLDQRLNAIQEENDSGNNVLHVLAMSDPESILSILPILPSASCLNLLQQPNQSGNDILTILKGSKDKPELLFATWRAMTQKWLNSPEASKTCAAVMRAYEDIDSTVNMSLPSNENLSAGQQSTRARLTELMLLATALYEAYHLLEQEVLTAKKIPGHEASQSLTAASQQAIDERIAYLNKCADNLKSSILAGSLPKHVFIQLCRFVGAVIGGLLFFAVGVRNGAYYGEQAACKLFGRSFFTSEENLYEFAQTVSTSAELRRAQISGGALQQFVNHHRDNSRVLAFFGAKPSQLEKKDDNPGASIETPEPAL